MAEPISTTLLLAKAALTAASNPKIRKGMGWIVGAILSPIIVIIALICGMLSGGTQHNINAVDYCFYGGTMGDVPAEYKAHLESMRDGFQSIEREISQLSATMDEGDSLDTIRVQAIFYALFFASDSPSSFDHSLYVSCFASTEERTRTVMDGDGNETVETYFVTIAIEDLSKIYGNIQNAMGIAVSLDNQNNAEEIYALVKYGHGADSSGNVPDLDVPIGDGSFSALLQEAEKYIGYPYVWGGSTPESSFDCSGYVCWVFTKSGVYNLPRTTASGIYYQCAVVPKGEVMAGDLVFFEGTYAGAGVSSHIGIYVGNGKMIHAGDPIGYADLSDPYYKKHFLSYGRLPLAKVENNTDEGELS